MRGHKSVVIFFLLSLAFANWIQEEPKHAPAPAIAIEPKYSAPQPSMEITKQSTVDVKAKIDVKDVPVQAPAEQAQTAEAVPSDYNESLDPFDHRSRMPDEEIEKHRHHHKKGKGPRHSKDIRQHKFKEGELPNSEYEGGLQMIMENQITALIVLAVIGLLIMKTCTRKNKCATRRAVRIRQQARQMNFVPAVPSSEGQAIDESIRYHEAEIMKLRNAAARQHYAMPMAYQ